MYLEKESGFSYLCIIMSASISCSVSQLQASSLNVLELFSMGINPTELSRFSKDLRKKLPVFSETMLGNPERRLANMLSCTTVSLKRRF